ncbi:MAG: MarR family transcriptional regulator [Staphylococcus pseudoxylosus]|uniref:MarR family winged helix-turn-helix transcriptional regulator n=1 Tax=Staphylococcus pseudoxylosus TaxID=2282419 RepID=UPI0031F5F889
MTDQKFLNIVNDINNISEKLYVISEKEERNFHIHNLNNQQQVILNLIINHPDFSPSDIAKTMNISKSAISQQLYKLEESGYIEKYKLESDKRLVRISLKEKGIEYKQQSEKYYEELLNKYKSQLSLKEVTDIRDSLEKLLQVINS